MTTALNLGRYGRTDPGTSSGLSQAFTGNATLTVDQSGLWCTNVGATGPVTLTMPAAVAGLSYAFQRSANYAFRIDPNGTETVANGSAGKYVEIMSAGVLVLMCVNTGSWVIASDSALWGFEA